MVAALLLFTLLFMPSVMAVGAYVSFFMWERFCPDDLRRVAPYAVVDANPPTSPLHALVESEGGRVRWRTPLPRTRRVPYVEARRRQIRQELVEVQGWVRQRQAKVTAWN